MILNGDTKIIGLFGNPVTHSKSPELQNKWIKENNLNAVYVPFHVVDIGVGVHSIRSLQLVGVNVTIPYKEAVIPFLDELSDEAKAIGAVNTILNKNGRLIGYNTDVFGIENSISEWLKKVKTCLVLGAGGAAKSMAYLCKKYKIETYIQNRTKEKARKLIDEFQLKGKYDNQIIDLIVNTTSVGMDGLSKVLDLNTLSFQPKYVYDIIYKPQKTPLLLDAIGCNAEVKNGESMLFEQGKASFEIWKPFLG